MDEEALSEIAKPFADEILRKHTPFHWQMMRSGPVQLGLVIWLLVAVFLILGCVYWRCFSRRARLLGINRRRQRGADIEDSYCCAPLGNIEGCRHLDMTPTTRVDHRDPTVIPRDPPEMIRSLGRYTYPPEYPLAHHSMK